MHPAAKLKRDDYQRDALTDESIERASDILWAARRMVNKLYGRADYAEANPMLVSSFVNAAVAIRHDLANRKAG
jgi:hypothetical protein